MIAGVPMAWLILLHDRRRLLLSAAGIGFAVLMVFVEIGVRNAMFDSQVLLIDKLDADLVIVNDRKFSLVFHEPFARRRLEQARAVPGVRTADPVYIEFDSALLKNPFDGSIQPIRVVAFDPAHCVFRDVEICRQTESLKQDETALYDRKSRSFFGLEANEVTELGHRTIRFVGSFALGTDFAHDGNLIMSDTSFFRYFASARAPNDLPARVELGVVTVDRSANPSEIADRLKALLPSDVRVLTRQQYIEQEKVFWAASTPVGYIFDLGALMGLVVGAIICYQILFTDVSRLVTQFATLRAIGYRATHVAAIVVEQAALLSLVGFVPGVAASAVLYALIAAFTGLPLRMSAFDLVEVLALTVLMCVGAGTLALRRALSLAPADVYR